MKNINSKRLWDSIETKSHTPLPSGNEMDNFISRYIHGNAQPSNKLTLINAGRYAAYNGRANHELSKKVKGRVKEITGFLERKYPYYIAFAKEFLEEKTERAEWRKNQSENPEDEDWLS